MCVTAVKTAEQSPSIGRIPLMSSGSLFVCPESEMAAGGTLKDKAKAKVTNQFNWLNFSKPQYNDTHPPWMILTREAELEICNEWKHTELISAITSSIASSRTKSCNNGIRCVTMFYTVRGWDLVVRPANRQRWRHSIESEHDGILQISGVGNDGRWHGNDWT